MTTAWLETQWQSTHWTIPELMMKWMGCSWCMLVFLFPPFLHLSAPAFYSFLVCLLRCSFCHAFSKPFSLLLPPYFPVPFSASSSIFFLFLFYILWKCTLRFCIHPLLRVYFSAPKGRAGISDAPPPSLPCTLYLESHLIPLDITIPVDWA